MLRTLVLALAMAAPGVALAHPGDPVRDQFPSSAVGAEVHGMDGTVIGRVTAVERDRDGNVVAAEIPGLEPADAPYSPTDLVAENAQRMIVAERADRAQSIILANRTRTR